MNFPDNLKYTKDHEWIRITDPHAEIGITQYAQDALGDVVFVDIHLQVPVRCPADQKREVHRP